MTTSISIANVTLRYGGTLAVDQFSIYVPEGEILSILGPSGCGKTSVLRLIAGFEVPLSGTIRLGDEIVSDPDIDLPPEMRKVGMLFQHGALFPHLTVRENVSFAIRSREKHGASVRNALSVTNLEGLEARFPHELSGGQQQRVALARAIVARPRVMLLDEPFSSLDAQMRSEVREQVIAVLRVEGITTILVTHDQEEALSCADRVAVMNAGRTLQIDTPAELYRRPASETVARFLGEGQLVNAQATAGVVKTEIGFVLRAEIADGPLVVLLRPEELEIGASAGISGRAASTRFFGHDQLVDLSVDGGEIAVRCDSRFAIRVGDVMTIGLKGDRFVGFRETASFELSS